MSEAHLAELYAFTTEHVARLTGLSKRQLGYWSKTGFFAPAFVDDAKRRAFGRIYSFRDVVGLRTIAILRKDHGLPLQELRRVGEWLHARVEAPWASLRFFVSGKRVLFLDPLGDAVTEALGFGQHVLPIDLIPIANEMSAGASRLRERSPDQVGQLTRNRYVVHNAWVVAGTRIPSSAIWNYHEDGFSTADILREYPSLKREDVVAAIEFEKSRRHAA